jgi:hypothetical protein
MIVTMMMVVSKRHHAHEIHNQTHGAHNKQFSQSLRFRSFPQTLKRFKPNFYTQQPIKTKIHG